MSAEFVNAAKGACPSSSLVFVQADLDRWGLRDVSLRPYQLDGVCWLAERHTVGHGCILGDEMGLGKTLQVFRVAAVLFDHAVSFFIVPNPVYILACVLAQACEE